MKAVKIVVTSTASAFKNVEGVVQCDMKSRGFCFIDQGDTTYLFHSTNLVNDDASKEAGNTVTAGHKVIFDAVYNHKYSPPKPFATNVRIVPGQHELNAVAASLEQRSSTFSTGGFESDTWQRNSRLDLPDDEDADTFSKRGSVSNRATALKANAPVRRWSRTSAGIKSDKPAGGIDMTKSKCKFGRKCNRSECWFEHPNGRQVDDGRTDLPDDSSSSDSDDSEKKQKSMGKASLRLLVTALVKEAGNSGYLTIRNALQKPDFVGRALTREEKQSVGEILEEITSEPDNATSRSSKITRTSRPVARSSFTGGRVSLSDLCKDPSLHSRLSAANGIRA